MSREMMPAIFPKPAETAPFKYAEFLLRAIGVKTNAEF